MNWIFLRNLMARLPGGRRLSAELAQSNRQRDLLRARLDRAERQRSMLRRRLEIRTQRARAAQPDEAVLEHVLPLRHAAMLAANHDGRIACESAFAGLSASYRDAIAHPDASSAVAPEPVTVAGLTWWIPAEAGDTEGITDRIAVKRRLPLREILETRELAIGRVMIDIGANIGTTSIPRVLLGDFDRIYAVEPDPANYACLVRNVVSNGVRGLVLPDRLAIGDATGTMTLRARKSGTHHLVTRADAVREEERITVPCTTLDAWVSHMGIDLGEVAFVKSDTQGWDARVLAGASTVLARRHIAWQIEFSPAMLQRAGTSLDELFDRLERHFTHFIDLRSEGGTRVRRTVELRNALAYVGKGSRPYTNVLLYAAG